MLLIVWRDDRLQFSVLMTLLLFMGMMAKPGFCLSCIKCDRADCDRPDTSKATTVCGDEDKSCFSYGKLGGDVIRGCASEALTSCMKKYIGEGKSCYFSEAGQWTYTRTKLEECLEGGPAGDGKLGSDRSICYCETDNCNHGGESGPTKRPGTPLGDFQRECYECKGKPGGDCAVGDKGKLGSRKKECRGGVCTKRSNKFDHYVTRGCDQNMTREHFDCLKKAYGEGLCIYNDDLHDTTPNNKKLDECLIDAGLLDAPTNQRSRQEIPEEALCICESDLCNPSHHSSPNNKLIISISMILATAFAFIPL